MQRYNEYDAAPAHWLALLPSHWGCKKIGSLFIERKVKVTDKDYPPLSVTKMGILPQLEDAAKTNDGDNRKLVCAGDFVINSRSDRKGSCGISELNGSVSLVYLVLIPREPLNHRYVHYLLRSKPFSEEFYRNGHGIVADLWTTRYSEMKTILLPVPPREEQDQIVRFLDWKVSAVNRLIDVKQHMIKGLEALMHSVVNHAVTYGLNSNVPMKYSGVKWLGEIPAHWRTVKLRKILHPVSIKNQPNLPLLSVVREQGVIIRDVEDKAANHNFIPDNLSNYKVLQKGQFVINKMKAWQGSYGISDYLGIVSPAYFVFDIDFNNLEYFHYAIRSKVYVNFFAQASDGIRVGQWDLQMDKMKEIPFIVPPMDEQIAIVTYIKETLSKNQKMISKLKHEIGFLEEYKAKLISDVVTGQVDVRDVEIPDLAYPEEIAPDTDAGGEDRDREAAWEA